MEEGVDGIRIMTVHKAKGLEFPVVLLVDITAKDTREPSRWVDQTAGVSAMRLAGCMPIEVQEHAADEMRIEQEEAARVLYVAATRARDLLVVCAVGDHPYDGWLATLNPVLYPSAAASFNALTNEAPGCPAFGDDTVVDRPQNAFRSTGSVSPGLHQPQVGEHRVVWWDPSVLAPPNSQIRSSSRLTDYLKEDDGRVHSDEGIRAHEEWQTQRASIRQVAGKPEWRVVTATAQVAMMGVDEASGRNNAEYLEATVESIQIDYTRPHGKRFGTLVHAVLSFVSLNSDQDGVAEIARLQGRILGAREEEVAAAVETVNAALSHPLMRRAAAAANNGQCRREVPIALKLDDDLMVEGVVDLAFRDQSESAAWTVVDYKTDFEVAGRLDEYRKQLGLYAFAISRATGIRTEAVLLRI